jgi:NAD(P)H dehydrogenase (quinone)
MRISAFFLFIITEPEKNYDKIYFLTSDQAVNYWNVAEAIGNAINEKVEYVPISLNEARKAMEQKGMPFALIETFIPYDEAQQKGETETVTDCDSFYPFFSALKLTVILFSRSCN